MEGQKVLEELVVLLCQRTGNVNDPRVQDWLSRNPSAREMLRGLSEQKPPVGKPPLNNSSIPPVSVTQSNINMALLLQQQQQKQQQQLFQLQQQPAFLDNIQSQGINPNMIPQQRATVEFHQFLSQTAQRHWFPQATGFPTAASGSPPPPGFQPLATNVFSATPKATHKLSSRAASIQSTESTTALPGRASLLSASEDMMHLSLLLAEVAAILCQEPGLKLGLAPLGSKLSSTSRLYLHKRRQRLKRFLATCPIDFAIDGNEGAESVIFVGGVERLLTYVETAAAMGIVPPPPQPQPGAGSPSNNDFGVPIDPATGLPRPKRGVLDMDQLINSPQLSHILQEVSQILTVVPGRQLLLSELGTRIGQEARMFLKQHRTRMGQLLLRFPRDFKIEGQKASGRVTLLRNQVITTPSSPVCLDRDLEAKAQQLLALAAQKAALGELNDSNVKRVCVTDDAETESECSRMNKGASVSVPESCASDASHPKTVKERLRRMPGMAEGLTIGVSGSARLSGGESSAGHEGLTEAEVTEGRDEEDILDTLRQAGMQAIANRHAMITPSLVPPTASFLVPVGTTYSQTAAGAAETLLSPPIMGVQNTVGFFSPAKVLSSPLITAPPQNPFSPIPTPPCNHLVTPFTSSVQSVVSHVLDSPVPGRQLTVRPDIAAAANHNREIFRKLTGGSRMSRQHELNYGEDRDFDSDVKS